MGELNELIEKHKKEASNAAQERDDAKKAYDAHVSLDTCRYSVQSVGEPDMLKALEGGGVTKE